MGFDTLGDLADKADAALAALTQHRTFEEARAALNEAGMNRARQRLVDALAGVEKAQGLLREQQEVAAQCKDRLDQVTAEAEWGLDDNFVVEGAKTFLVDGETRKAMTADERKTWKAQAARKHPDVADAAAACRRADADLNACRDQADHSRLAFSAAKNDLAAACTTVEILAASIRSTP